jgi:hypothetical protein
MKNSHQSVQDASNSSSAKSGFAGTWLSSDRANTDHQPWDLDFGKSMEISARKTGWWLTYPSEKLLFPIYGKIKNIPNHQPRQVRGIIIFK